MRSFFYLLLPLLLIGCISRTQIETLKEDEGISGTIFGLQDEDRITSKEMVWIWEDAFWE